MIFYLKDKGFVHNDIKTQNICLTPFDGNNQIKHKKSIRFIDLGESNCDPQTLGFTP